MNVLDYPLSEEELDELDHFLLYRGEEDDLDEAFVEGADEGILCLSGLDGFLTAVVSGPVTLAPSQWLPAVWGDEAPAWESAETFERIFTMMLRHMNYVIGALRDPEFAFEPIFNEGEIDGKQQLIVDEWCEGFIRGVVLVPEAWEAGGEAMTELLAPILLFASEQGWALLEEMDGDEVAAMQDAIPDAAEDIHDFWLERRPSPMAHEVPKAGHNDPCPCGSGRRYRHCCLH